MPQVIEWVSSSPDDIIYRYPDENIQWGAQLIVHEYESAVFFRDGKSYDTLGPGRHTLTTLNLPLITKILSRLAGYQQTPFKANVIFVSNKQFTGKFGNRAQTTELAPLMTFGSFWFRIEDPSIFVNEVVGGQNAYTTPDVNNYLRGFINEKMIDVLSKYDLQTVFTKLDDTSNEVKASLLDYFKRIGVQMIDLKFEGIDTTPEFRDRLFWLKTGRVSSDEVIRMETVKQAAAELGKSSGGAAFGTGMVLVPPLFQPAAGAGTEAAVALVVCPNCQAHIPATSKFCPNCGQNMTIAQTPPNPAPGKKCPKCNSLNAASATFCQNCGNKLT
ncbi:MAG TPA: SPFH domain-containing protein [Candidatus Bathyarchaeia archaeon]|nr:SPFH domain-containing protein [Candidatus Bathyarchaeia archaeon]